MFMHSHLEQHHSPIRRSSPDVTYNKIDDAMTSMFAVLNFTTIILTPKSID